MGTYAAPITTSAPIRSAPMSYGTTVGAPMSYPSTLTSSVGLGAYGGVVVGYGGVRSYGAPISYGASYPSTTYGATTYGATTYGGARLPTPGRRRRRLDRHLKLRRR